MNPQELKRQEDLKAQLQAKRSGKMPNPDAAEMEMAKQRIKKSITRNEDKNTRHTSAYSKRRATKRGINPKWVHHSTTTGELLRKYDLGDLADLLADKELTNSQMLKRSVSNRIIGASKFTKIAGAVGLGMLATNIANDILFDEPVAKPIELLQVAGVSYVGYKVGSPVMKRVAGELNNQARKSSILQEAVSSSLPTKDAYESVMDHARQKTVDFKAKKKADLIQGRVRKTGKVAAGFIGTTALLGMANNQLRKAKAENVKKDYEKQRIQEQKEEQKRREKYRQGVSFGNVNAGEIAFQLFEQRTGHHKMGNSKF